MQYLKISHDVICQDPGSSQICYQRCSKIVNQIWEQPKLLFVARNTEKLVSNFNYHACVHFNLLVLQRVTIAKAGGPLGLSIVGGTDHTSHPFGVEEPGIFISKVSALSHHTKLSAHGTGWYHYRFKERNLGYWSHLGKSREQISPRVVYSVINEYFIRIGIRSWKFVVGDVTL